ncbi:MAG: hypothetical protein LUC92_00005 [Clostridiales bacterium]|nr:hypothetical protein [Clostridiales bacterium]
MASHSKSPEAHSRAVAKYTKNNYDRIDFKMTKESGLKAKLTDHVSVTGESINQFITRAVIETISRDEEKAQPDE